MASGREGRDTTGPMSKINRVLLRVNEDMLNDWQNKYCWQLIAYLM